MEDFIFVILKNNLIMLSILWPEIRIPEIPVRFRYSHGGQIWAQNNYDDEKGSTFSFTIKTQAGIKNLKAYLQYDMANQQNKKITKK